MYNMCETPAALCLDTYVDNRRDTEIFPIYSSFLYVFLDTSMVAYKLSNY